MSDFSRRIGDLSPQKRALLARRLGRRLASTAPPPSPLVEIKPQGDKPPFFCVHPSGGAVACYYDLAHSLGPDQPFYGLQALGLAAEALRHTRVEDMAADYVAAVRGVRPDGPYLLGGWSMGALVAYEMARQLAASGQRVDLLALFDMWVIREQERVEVDEALILMGFLGNRLSVPLEHLRSLAPDDQLAYVLGKAREADLLPFEVTLEEARRIVRVCKANDLAAQQYRPPPYAGRVNLFRADEERDRVFGQQRRPDAPDMGWGAVASGGVTIHQVPGDHDSLVLKPHVRVLAERLKACLDRPGGVGRAG